jgi:hypothetical protein
VAFDLWRIASSARRTFHLRGPLKSGCQKTESEFAERCWAESASANSPVAPSPRPLSKCRISKIQIQFAPRTTREQRLPIGAVPRLASGSSLPAGFPVAPGGSGHVKVSPNAFEGASPRRAIRVHVCAATRMALLVEDRVPLTKDGASTLRGSQNS